jgi:uncharacterized protein YlbG (UPF0298 family)
MIKIEYKTYSNEDYGMPVYTCSKTNKKNIVDGLKQLKYVKAIRVNGVEIRMRSETR